jgi:predicted ATPase/transcriptional regulator with XRE-family HTH domain
MEEHSFGYWLRLKRKALDLTREGLADRVGYSAATIRKVEAEERRPSAQMVERLAEILDIPQDERAAFLRFARGDWKYAPNERPSIVPSAIGSNDLPALHNLPAQLTSFVGRQKEIAEIKQHLGASRLVTLTGPGGTGKTRLALQVANDLRASYPDGVWWVELAPLRDPGLVAEAIAQALKLSASGEAPLVELLKRRLRRMQVLLLLDNFEHLLPAGPLVGELLAAAPQVWMLVTSRERLHVYGEQEYPVHPLELPDLQRDESAEELLAHDAVSLFVQRARAVQPGFSLDEAQKSAVARICVRLDGLPLALELAASQVKIIPPPQLEQRLQDSLGTLPIGPRDRPDRQRTLRATIQWSYALLNEGEQALFARMAVFNGGATLDAIERVCGYDQTDDLVNTLTALVDKNLVFRRDHRLSEPRFAMLETIHEYARERLQASGEAAQVQEHYVAYYTSLAEQAAGQIRANRQSYWLNRMKAEQDNLRAVLAWTLEGQDTLPGLRLVAALRDHWYYNGLAGEGRRWTDLALRKSTGAPPALRAGVLRAAGQIAIGVGDLPKAGELLSQALALYRQLEDERNTAWTLVLLSLYRMGDVTKSQKNMALCQEGLEIFRRLDDQPGMAQAFNILGELARLAGDDEAASGYYEECLKVVKQTGERLREGMTYCNLSFIAYHRAQYQPSEQFARQALRISWEMGNEYMMAAYLASLAGPVAALGDPRRAACLLGASQALLEKYGFQLQPSDTPEVQRYIAVLQSQLSAEDLREAWQAGSAMTLQEVIDYALDERKSDPHVFSTGDIKL